MLLVLAPAPVPGPTPALWAGVADAQTPTADDLFDDNVLHEIRLVLNPRDWASLKENFQLNDYYPCHLMWNGLTIRNVGIRSRGLGSRSGTKPGLRVDFDRYSATQTFLGLTSVVLRNNTQDPSSLHERLSMRLFSSMGVMASRTAHARLFVNNEYVGLYLIVESVDKRFLKRNFKEDGGYLYNYQWTSPYYFEFKGADPSIYTPRPFQAETHEKDPDPRPLVEMIRAINETPETDFLTVVNRHVDLRTFLRQVAVENFLADQDGALGYAGMNNLYIYRFEGTERTTFIPWDKSEAFKGGVAHPIWYNIYDVPSWLRNRLMDRAMAFPELRDLYLDTLLKSAEIAASGGWLEQEALRAYGQIRQAALDDPFKPFSNQEFEQDVQHVLDFARSRSAFVVAEVRRSR
jgi:hypothetical protein